MTKDPHNIKFVLTNLSGEKVEYDLQPLKRKDAAYVAHTFLQTILKALSGAIAGSGDSNEKAKAVVDSLSKIDFETIWSMASILLKYARIKTENGIVEINDLDECDYFAENPDELYLAVYHGILENYPKVFSRVRDLMSGLGQQISERMKNLTLTQAE
ncbi:hypothetical protein GWN42_13590 [candidate division KSB1 bacterium]|nr:hypothetical protein [candidate division KSB1 bacterium]